MVETLPEFYTRTSTLPPPEKTATFLNQIPHTGTMLDFGCGSGRWAAAFKRDRPDLTIDVLDKDLPAAPLIGADWKGTRYHQSFETFRPEKAYDAIWAFATLFFLQHDTQKDVLTHLRHALKASGVLFFTMVEPDVRKTFHGWHADQIEPLLTEAGLRCTRIKNHVDLYGVEKQEILTHYVTAQRL